MTKTILITGATDGIGLLTAQKLSALGHSLILHGRSEEKLDRAIESLGTPAQGLIADFSDLTSVKEAGETLLSSDRQIDVLINNAGVLKAPITTTGDGHDIRMVVNLFAPVILTEMLLPIIAKEGRVLNLSSAAQSPVHPSALRQGAQLDDMEAYAQSKLAFSIWSAVKAEERHGRPSFIAINPGSFLASKMVKDGFGMAGNDLNIGADILIKAALSEAFAEANGTYFDNDIGAFGTLHPAASDQTHNAALMNALSEATQSYL